MADTKHLEFLYRALNLVDSTKSYGWLIKDGVEFITIQLFHNSIISAYLSIEDAIELLEEKLLHFKGAKALYEKFKRARD